MADCLECSSLPCYHFYSLPILIFVGKNVTTFHQYLRWCHIMRCITVFRMPSTIILIQSLIASMICTKVGLFVHVIYYLGGLHCMIEWCWLFVHHGNIWQTLEPICYSRAEHYCIGSPALGQVRGEFYLPCQNFTCPIKTSDLSVSCAPQKLDLSYTEELGMSNNALLKCTCLAGRWISQCTCPDQCSAWVDRSGSP